MRKIILPLIGLALLAGCATHYHAPYAYEPYYGPYYGGPYFGYYGEPFPPFYRFEHPFEREREREERHGIREERRFEAPREMHEAPREMHERFGGEERAPEERGRR